MGEFLRLVAITAAWRIHARNLGVVDSYKARAGWRGGLRVTGNAWDVAHFVELLCRLGAENVGAHGREEVGRGIIVGSD